MYLEIPRQLVFSAANPFKLMTTQHPNAGQGTQRVSNLLSRGMQVASAQLLSSHKVRNKELSRVLEGIWNFDSITN